MNHMYKPLPKELRLGFSDIHDIGLFAKEKIKRGHDFGVCHLKIGKELFRTPLGGFVNHSNTPNCTKSMFRITNSEDVELKRNYKIWRLITLEDIKEGEELTLEYTFYKIYEEKNEKSR
jgi:SET domain-containing protein